MELESLQELFTKKIFRIPDYQRGYAWGTKQLSEFWDDLVNLPEGRDHYFGMVTLREIEDFRDESLWPTEHWLVVDCGYAANYVVDGQQRLTTAIILISAIVDFVKAQNDGLDFDEIKFNKRKLSEVIEDYLYVTEDEIYDTFIFGYKTDDPSYNFFKAKILGLEEESEKSHIEETFYTLNLENAKKFFSDELLKVFKNEGILGIENIYRKLTQRLKVNIYEISDDFDVFVTFETMNNRGKRLSVLELLKNRLIYLSTLFAENDERQRGQKIKVRENINNAWKSIYNFLGKNKEHPLRDDDYLRDHWIVYFGYQTRQKDNYENALLKKYFSRNRIAEYRDEVTEDLMEAVESNGDDLEAEEVELEVRLDVQESNDNVLTLKEISDYVNSLKKMVRYWYATYFPDDEPVAESGELKEILRRLARLDYGYFRPLAMVILEKDVAEEKKLQAFSAMERYIFLHFRLAGNPSASNRSPFYRLTREFYNNRVDIDKVIDALSKVECVQQGVLRTDLVYAKTFERLFDKSDGYYSWGRGNDAPGLRYFLYEYETNLKDANKAAMKVDPEEFFKADPKDKVSIEHIYPQTPKDRWVELFSGYNTDELKRLTGTLGNLLALSQRVNSSVQNEDFEKKKKRYLENSHSAVNVAMPRDADGELLPYEDWTPERIRARGIDMLNFMAGHWKFKFRNETDMLKLLGLSFMADEPEESWEGYTSEVGSIFTEPAVATKKTRGPRLKITPEVVQLAYVKAKEVHEGKIDAEEALNELEKVGNRSSMNMYIYAFEAMLNGKNYTMDINPYALNYYVDNLLKDYGEGCRENIIRTLTERVRRYKGERVSIKEEEVLARLRKA